MADDYIFPTSARIQKTAQDKFPRLTADRPVFNFFPIQTMDEDELIWEQLQNYTGLQQGRGLDGQPPSVTPAGMIRMRDNPGYYGEHIPITEAEITRRRQPGTFGDVIDLTELVMTRQDQLLLRRRDRQEKNIWDMLINGSISIPGPTGAVIDSHAYLRQTFPAAQFWSNAAIATPLADFRAMKLLARGHSVDFGAGATAYMNQTTMNQMLLNTNGADLYGRRTAGLGTFNVKDQVDQLMLGDDLPKIQVYDETYLLDGSVIGTATDFTQFGTYALFIPDGYAVVIGKRPNNEPVGTYYETRNANNPAAAPGAYMQVKDNANESSSPPRRIAVHDGHNGFPCLMFPSAVCIMHVT